MQKNKAKCIGYFVTSPKLRASNSIQDLYKIRSLNYEKLKGNKNGLESVRVNDKYRIEFKSSTERTETNVITICSIIELSNHYS